MAKDTGVWSGTGRLAKDVDMRINDKGTPYIIPVSFANSKQYFSAKEGDDTNWFKLRCSGKTAEYLNQYGGKKGTRLAVTGSLSIETREYEGTKYTDVVISADQITILSTPEDGERRSSQANNSRPAPQARAAAPERRAPAPRRNEPQPFEEDEDLPF